MARLRDWLRCRRARRPRVGWGLQNSGEQLPRRRAWVHSHLTSKYPHALVISAQRAGPVLIGEVQPHQQLMMCLAKRFEGDEAVGPRNGGGEIFPLFGKERETVQYPGHSLSVFVAKRGDPIVV